MTLWSVALGAPVVCDGARALRIVEDAGIPPSRVPATQPNLLPGLARGADDEVGRALDAFCARPGGLSLAPAERWETAEGGAWSFVLTRSETSDCALLQEALVLTIAVTPGRAPTYGIRSRLPPTVSPVGTCEGVQARYRSETVLDGSDGPVRVVWVRDLEGDEVVGSRVVVRRATPDGWTEAVLLDPAPARLADPAGGGPVVALTPGMDPWIVASGDRAIDGDTCRPVPGQTVWRWADGAWVAEEGRVALGSLAGRGAWRLAGEDAWFLILAQDTESDREQLEVRRRRLQRRDPVPLHLLESASFPGMNAGFLIVTPDPWPTEEEAERARQAWSRRTGVYVRRGWTAPDPCELTVDGSAR